MFDRLDTEGTEFVTSLALCTALDKFALQRIYSVAQLSTSIRALDTMVLERDEFKSMVIRWLNMCELPLPMKSSNRRRERLYPALPSSNQLYPALAVDEAADAAASAAA